MDILELTKKLISIKSFSGDEKSVFEFASDWFRRNKFEYIKQDEMFVAALKTKTGAPKAIILSGHLDTVVSGDESLWSASPFEATRKSGKLIGLGSSDMKAAVAAQMLAVRDSERDDLDIWSVAVANEEIDGAGSEAFMEWFQAEFDYDEVVCVIGEPTDLDRIEVGHRGNRFVKLEFAAISGHASQQASFDSSALAKASLFLADI
ncbi:MAG: M20/M25/M40 family metallo-hydrolase, partial [Candidatus Sacchiramonaceae bacterium]|nr:M20/M25/M40 family metallo-hydrolase [Candidatus Saccharimonadaceae bacterium]